MEKLLKLIADPQIRAIVYQCVVTKPITMNDPLFPIMVNLMQTLKDTLNKEK
jgi:hypothetical protein